MAAAVMGSMNLLITPLIYLFLASYLGAVALITAVNLRYFSSLNLLEASRAMYLVHLLFIAISALFALHLFSGIWYLVSVGLFFLLLMLFFYRVCHEGNFEFLLNTLFWLTMGIFAASVVMRLGGVAPGLVDLSKIAESNSLLSQGLAFSGLQTNQNTFGVVAAIGFALSMYQFVQRRGLVWFIFSLLCIAASIALILSSTSRASLLMAGVFGLMFGGALLRRRKVLMIAFVSVGSLASAFIIYELHKYIAIAERLEQGSATSGRAVIWMDAFETGLDNLFTGVGPLQYEFLGFGRVQHAHNLYFDTFANLGLLGFLSLIAFLSYMLTMSLLKFVSGNVRRVDKVPFFFSFSFLCAVLIHQMFEARAFLPFSHIGIAVVFVLGHLMFIINKGREDKKYCTEN